MRLHSTHCSEPEKKSKSKSKRDKEAKQEKSAASSDVLDLDETEWSTIDRHEARQVIAV